MMIYLFGAGRMGKEYAKVLRYLDHKFTLVTSRTPRDILIDWVDLKLNNVRIITLEEYFRSDQIAESVIVAVKSTATYKLCVDLLNQGVKEILAEKPLAYNSTELFFLKNLVEANKANLLIAYNRRFYQTINKVKDIALEDGGIDFISLDISERLWTWEPEWKSKTEILSEYPLISQTSHMFDLVQYFLGEIKLLNVLTTGKFNYFDKPKFIINCQSNDGILVNFYGNWAAPGNWQVKLSSKRTTFQFSNLENVSISKREVDSDVISFSKSEENSGNFKAGVLEEVQAFINRDWTKFCKIEDQQRNLLLMEKIMLESEKLIH
jgi:predicted dehydrogenase